MLNSTRTFYCGVHGSAMSCSTRSSTLADATLDRENKWIYTAPHLNGCFLTPWHFLYPTSMHVAERASTYHTALCNITCILHIAMIPAHISALLFTNIKATRNPQLFSIHRLSPHSPKSHSIPYSHINHHYAIHHHRHPRPRPHHRHQRASLRFFLRQRLGCVQGSVFGSGRHLFQSRGDGCAAFAVFVLGEELVLLF
jgi:hypothetical protein